MHVVELQAILLKIFLQLALHSSLLVGGGMGWSGSAWACNRFGERIACMQMSAQLHGWKQQATTLPAAMQHVDVHSKSCSSLVSSTSSTHQVVTTHTVLGDVMTNGAVLM